MGRLCSIFVLLLVFTVGCTGLVGPGDDGTTELTGKKPSKKSFSLGQCSDLDKLAGDTPDYRFYNWDQDPHGCGRIERFIPMVWGAPLEPAAEGDRDFNLEIRRAKETLRQQSPEQRFLLGPNECDLHDQCNQPIRTVAQMWRKLEEEFLHKVDPELGEPLNPKLVFAVPTNGGADREWIWRVIGMYEHLYGELPHIDRFALHFYGDSTSDPDPAKPLKDFMQRQIATIPTGGLRSNVAGPCAESHEQGKPCRIETRTWIFNDDGRKVESLTANGSIFNYEDGAPWLSNGTPTHQVKRYNDGSATPCHYMEDELCRFETRVVRVESNGDKIEEITAYGRMFVYKNGVVQPKLSALPLSDSTHFSRYSEHASDPCHGMSGNTCRFDTRTAFYDLKGNFEEGITIGNRWYHWENGVRKHPLDGSNKLSTQPRYTSGGVKACIDDNCRFDTRMVWYEDGKLKESMFTRGRGFSFTDREANPWNGNILNQVDHYDDRYVYRGNAYAGTKVWLTEFGTRCYLNHGDDFTLRYMRSATEWLENAPEVERYFWFTSRITGKEPWALNWQSCTLIDTKTGNLTALGQEYAR